MSDTTISSAPAPRYSLTLLILASLLLPPLGLLLLWIRRDFSNQQKILGSLCIAALACGYLYFLFGSRSNNNEAHYAALERHRAEQQAALPEVTTASAAVQTSPAPGAVVQPSTVVNTGGQPASDAAVVSAQINGGQPAQENAAGNQAIDVAGAQAAPSVAPPTRPARNYWTNFRGPSRDGRYTEVSVKTKWAAEGLPLLWRQPVGGGYASFVVADNTAYTIEQRRGQEVVAAYNVDTGRELWTNGWNAEFRESMGGDGPRATPTWDGGRLYALGATGEFRCLDARSGKPIWSRNILKDNGASNLQWGMSASPLIVDDKVIVLPGGTSGKSVVAYNKMTGAPVWKVLDDQASYTSPMLATLAGRRQILIVTARRLVGLTPEDGSLLWEHAWANQASINVSQPIIVDRNRVFISAGYGKGAALVEVSGNGDKTFAARTVWENNAMKNKFNSSVLHNGHIYGLDEGILTCVNVATGERKWKGGRYGYGQVLLAGGNLLVSTEDGEIVLVRATPEQHSEVAKFSALEGRTWNVPAIANGRLLVRNTTHMACYNLAAE